MNVEAIQKKYEDQLMRLPNGFTAAFIAMSLTLTISTSFLAGSKSATFSPANPSARAHAPE
jgi:hypothetical protein